MRTEKCKHRNGYYTRVVDIDDHIATFCDDCGEQVFL